MERLPLFLLKTVLFPGTPLPLHVFEERYRLMIGRCIEERAPFGVVLIRSGEEVGGAAEPYTIGTSAHIRHMQRLPDDQMNLLALGEQRFRILDLDRSESYFTAEIEYLASEGVDAPETADEARRVAALFGEQFRLVMAVTGQWLRTIALPGEPDRLADFVAGQVDLTSETKQELLETLSAPARLRREAELLGALIRKLTERWEEVRQTKFAGAALN